MHPSVSEDDVKAYLQRLLDTIRLEGNPDQLNRYRSLFRKQVPFFMRSYVAAFLIQQALEGAGAGHRQTRSRRSKIHPSLEGSTEPSNELKTEEKKQNLPEEAAARIFISVGRNRRVFPREILSLILSETELQKEDIGLIRILDSYSFVQVRKEKADSVIAALNGKLFKGRTLTVNFARSKTSESQAESNEGENIDSFEDFEEDHDIQSEKEDLPSTH